MQGEILSEGYGIMPNKMLFNAELSSTAKLMFCYISSLCASTGQCRPRNKHLAEKFNLKQRQVTNVLEEIKGYVYAFQDERGRRILMLTPDLTGDEPGSKKLLGGTQKIAIHSNINSKEKEYTSEMKTGIEKVYDYWLKLMVVDPAIRAHGTTDEKRAALLKARKHTRLTDLRKARSATRIKSMGLEKVLRAVVQISKSDFHRGDNDRGWMAKFEWFLEKDERIEEWANKGGAE